MKAPIVNLYDDASERWRLAEGDALSLLAALPENCLDAVLCDPPYAIGAMGQAWDGRSIQEAMGVAHLPDAFERWTQVWASECLRVLKPGGHLLAFGAPRTVHRLTCGIEDADLEIRDVVMWIHAQGLPKSRRLPGGLGTALKPAWEPVVVARKAVVGTVAENIERWGTGALNIEAARIGESLSWPANVATGNAVGLDAPANHLFFCAKPARSEREAGCEALPKRTVALYTGKRHSPRLVHNIHPTVKPVELMRWLVRLAVPHGGIVLDPFTGSGTTGVAALLEGRRFVGIEREPEYLDVACARLAHWAKAVNS